MTNQQLEPENMVERPARPPKVPSDYLSTVLFFLLFVPLLLVWEVVQRGAFYLKGEGALHRVDRTLNLFILHLLRITGARYEVVNPYVFPNSSSYILVSNHQSMFDISLLHELVWQHTPRFIAKRELGSCIPGISFNLRAGGHALIDRSAGSKALAEIVKLGRRLKQERFAVVIFPEGTRARDSKLKVFKPSGLQALIRSAPEARIVIVAIDGSWKLQAHSCWPIINGAEVRVRVLDVLDSGRFTKEGVDIVNYAHDRISQQLMEWRS